MQHTVVFQVTWVRSASLFHLMDWYWKTDNLMTIIDDSSNVDEKASSLYKIMYN